MIPADISSDVQKPSLEIASPELFDPPISREEGLLNSIFRRLGVVEHTQGEIIDLLLVDFHQLIEIVHVAGLTPLNQPGLFHSYPPQSSPLSFGTPRLTEELGLPIMLFSSYLEVNAESILADMLLLIQFAPIVQRT